MITETNPDFRGVHPSPPRPWNIYLSFPFPTPSRLKPRILGSSAHIHCISSSYSWCIFCCFGGSGLPPVSPPSRNGGWAKCRRSRQASGARHGTSSRLPLVSSRTPSPLVHLFLFPVCSRRRRPVREGGDGSARPRSWCGCTTARPVPLTSRPPHVPSRTRPVHCTSCSTPDVPSPTHPVHCTSRPPYVPSPVRPVPSPSDTEVDSRL